MLSKSFPSFLFFFFLLSRETWDLVSSAGSTEGLEHLSGFVLLTVRFAPLCPQHTHTHTPDLLFDLQCVVTLLHDVMSDAGGLEFTCESL